MSINNIQALLSSQKPHSPFNNEVNAFSSGSKAASFSSHMNNASSTANVADANNNYITSNQIYGPLPAQMSDFAAISWASDQSENIDNLTFDIDPTMNSGLVDIEDAHGGMETDEIFLFQGNLNQLADVLHQNPMENEMLLGIVDQAQQYLGGDAEVTVNLNVNEVGEYITLTNNNSGEMLSFDISATDGSEMPNWSPFQNGMIVDSQMATGSVEGDATQATSSGSDEQSNTDDTADLDAA